MRHLRKLIVILFAIMAFSLTLFACSEKAIDYEKLEDMGFTLVATFNCNGGKMDKYEIRNMYVKPNSKLLEPGVDASKLAPVLMDAAHEIEGWYIVTLDDEGKIVSYDKKWDFDNDRVTENITLYAKWMKTLAFRIVYGVELNEERIYYHSNKLPPSELPLQRPSSIFVENQTFIDFYLDSDFDVPAVFPLEHANADENNIMTIYARYIEGTFRLVRTAADLANIGQYTNLYFLTDEIDMDGITWYMPSKFSGTIKGNGATIKNIDLSLSLNSQANRNIKKIGLFGELDGAVFEDITFASCKVTATLRSGAGLLSVGFLAGEMNNVTFKNAHFSGELTIIETDNYSLSDDHELYGEIKNGDLTGVTYDIIKNKILPTD